AGRVRHHGDRPHLHHLRDGLPPRHHRRDPTLAGPSQSGNLKRLGSDHDPTEDRGLTPLKSTSESKKRGHFTVPPPFFVSASGGFSHFALLAQAEIAFDDTRIARQFFGLALEHHLSRSDHIPLI